MSARRWRVIRVTRRAGGRVSRAATDAQGEAVSFGRAPGCTVHLNDPRTPLVHARAVELDGDLFVRAEEGKEVAVGGRRLRQVRLEPGVTVTMGPWDLGVEVAPEGFAAQLTIELSRPLGDDVEGLLARSRIRVSDSAPSLAALVVTAAVGTFLGAIWPLAVRLGPVAASTQLLLSPMISPGLISPAHRPFSGACETCHTEPFASVPSAACAACHPDTPAHQEEPTSADVARCASCHVEHTGAAPVIAASQAFCVQCHGEGEAPVSTFEVHPVFAALSDPGELRFSHERHLTDARIRDPEGARVLECGDCHEADGAGMIPVNMERHCAACHPLVGEEAIPHRLLPHGDPALARAVAEDTWVAAVARGEVVPPVAGRRRPGSPIEAGLNTDRLGFGRAACGTCHAVRPGDDGWTVDRWEAPDSWRHAARFDHEPHGHAECVDCHDVAGSASARDVLLPGVEVCRSCHGGQWATDRVPSPCVTCHAFHVDGHPPMEGL